MKDVQPPQKKKKKKKKRGFGTKSRIKSYKNQNKSQEVKQVTNISDASIKSALHLKFQH